MSMCPRVGDVEGGVVVESESKAMALFSEVLKKVSVFGATTCCACHQRSLLRAAVPG